jgi:hypothetical protein
MTAKGVLMAGKSSLLRIALLNTVLGAFLLSGSVFAQETPTEPPPAPPSDKKSVSTEAGTTATPKKTTISAPAYNMKLRELEEKVVGLKEKIFKSKTRLLLLKEQILHNVIAEARAVIIHNNDMGSAFTLVQVLYRLDADKIYFQDNKDGILDEKTEFEIFNGNMLPGNHTISVELVYRGDGTIFSYIDGYTFKISSSYTFFATKGRITRIKVVGYEKGGITTDLEQKPYVRYDVQQFRYTNRGMEAGQGVDGSAPDSND